MAGSMLCFGIFLMVCNPSQAQEPVVPHATFCETMNTINGGPIIWSPSDTRRTKEQADKINRVGKSLCGWGKKK
jgi:hypothetical protein